MEKLNVSNRIKAVAQLLERADRIADIGCDHAYLSIYAIREKLAKSAVAMDVKEGPLKTARENIVSRGMEDKIETRLSDGGKELKLKECDSAVMAGMGGMLIERILLESLPVFYEMKQIILEPQSDVPHLREFLYFTGFEIENENLVFEDGKYYPILRIRRRLRKKAPDRPGEVELIYGKGIISNHAPAYDDYLAKERKKLERAIKEVLKGREDEVNDAKLKELESRLAVNSAAAVLRGTCFEMKRLIREAVS